MKDGLEWPEKPKEWWDAYQWDMPRVDDPSDEFNDLQFDLCTGCGERSPEGQGLIAMVMHACAGNTIEYNPSIGLKVRHLMYLTQDPFETVNSLLDFPHFKRMPNYSTATILEKKIYSLCRDLEIRHMKRLRDYIKLEKRLFDTFP